MVEAARGLSLLLAESVQLAKRLPQSKLRDRIGRQLEAAQLGATLLGGRPAERSEAERGAVQGRIEHVQNCVHSAQDWKLVDGVLRCDECEEASALLDALAVIERVKREASRLQQIAEQHQQRNAELETETARQRDEMLAQAAEVREHREELTRTIAALRKTIRERDAATKARDDYAQKLRSLGFSTAVHS